MKNFKFLIWILGNDPTSKNCTTTDFCITFFIDPDYNDGAIGHDVPTKYAELIIFSEKMQKKF
jgi:hypothetical protein